MSSIFGAVGSIAGAAIQSSAMKNVAKMQIDALNKQRDFVFKELEPNKINLMASAADIDRAQSQLALQGQLDPDLLRARYAGEAKLLKGVEELGAAPSDVAAQQAFTEAMAQGETGVAAQMKQKLIDAALSEIEAGATLPNDVQAELARAGLERSGTVLGAATPRGIGGNMARELIGTAALNLKAQRQERAQKLTASASALEDQRNKLMLSLFPELQAQQLNNLNAAGGAVKASAAELAPVGLSGESIANIWLARVGATNQLSQGVADAAAKNAAAQGQIWSGAIGAGTQALGNQDWSWLAGGNKAGGGGSAPSNVNFDNWTSAYGAVS
jgi:hypothetical protein